MTTKPKLMTADELLAMPRGDGKKYELIRGVLVEKVTTGRPPRPGRGNYHHGD